MLRRRDICWVLLTGKSEEREGKMRGREGVMCGERGIKITKWALSKM